MGAYEAKGFISPHFVAFHLAFSGLHNAENVIFTPKMVPKM